MMISRPRISAAASLGPARKVAAARNLRPCPSESPARPAARHPGCMLGNRSSRTIGVPSAMASHLFDPPSRDVRYGEPGVENSSSDVAQYLLDLHDGKATFNFCGGMMFQFVLTDKLYNHLAGVAQSGGQQPAVWPASKRRMAMLPIYSQDASADNVNVFHGREVRRVPDAEGGMGFVLQLSFAGEDPEGWTAQEVEEYSGWLSDQQRRWRTGDLLESEGVAGFKSRFGPEAFTLHHRFYLHLDGSKRVWLSAEDGCEGTPAPAAPSLADRARAFFS